MRSTSKVIIGAALIMVISLAIILGLLLVLLAELYCSLLLRRRQLQYTSPSVTTTTTANSTVVDNAITVSTTSTPPPPRLNAFYSQGVLTAPRSFLLPKLCNKLDPKTIDVENPPHRSQLRQLLESNFMTNYSINNTPRRIGIVSSFPSPPPQTANYFCDDSDSPQRYVNKDKLVYISNPIYDNHVVIDTPFETPDTTPSRLETGSGSSGDDEESAGKWCTQSKTFSATSTPPLTPMKKLPAQACSVSLSDARSFSVSVTDSNSRNNNNGETSSSTGSPRTSPSW